MKKLLLFIAAIAVIAGCTKKTEPEFTGDNYNGYDQFHKAGEIVKDLRIRGGEVGTVTYGLILNDPPYDVFPHTYFYIAYETDPDWEIVKTHAYAGKWKYKPRNKRNKRKRKSFMHKNVHNPYVAVDTFKIDLTTLPPYTDPGFIVAAHAKVYNPDKCGDNGYRHAWADWDRRFRCSGWAGYSIYYYEEPAEPHTNYYAVDYDENYDSLYVYLVDIDENGDVVADKIFSEPDVGNPPGDADDGVAIDAESNNIFFINYDKDSLMVNSMDEEETPSYGVGELPLASSISTVTFQKDENANTGTLYYVNEISDPEGGSDFELHAVTISEDTDGNFYFYASDDVVIETIANDSILAIKDIAIEPLTSGDDIFLIGEVSGENAQLLIWEQTGGMTTQDIIDLDGNQISTTTDPQLAFSEDGDLYMIQGSIGSGGIVSGISPQTGNVISVEESEVIIIDPPIPPKGVAGTITLP